MNFQSAELTTYTNEICESIIHALCTVFIVSNYACSDNINDCVNILSVALCKQSLYPHIPVLLENSSLDI